MKRAFVFAATILTAVVIGLAAPPTSTSSPVPSVAAVTVRIAAVGDIACAPGFSTSGTHCKHPQVAQLVSNSAVGGVLTLGDNQYESGTLAQFQGSYDKSWGSLKPKTFPTIGNHEYNSGGSGYYSYFGSRAQGGAPGYYAYNLGAWRMYALNSNCSKISCSAQANWLKADLAANPRRCSLAAMHHPKYSSGQHGSSSIVNSLWQAFIPAKLDVVLAGHDHNYERFARMGLNGPSATGARQFVSGLGGKEFRSFGSVKPGSEKRFTGKYGALIMSLSDTGYSWQFKTIDGVVRDSGSDSCVA